MAARQETQKTNITPFGIFPSENVSVSKYVIPFMTKNWIKGKHTKIKISKKDGGINIRLIIYSKFWFVLPELLRFHINFIGNSVKSYYTGFKYLLNFV